MPKRTLAIVVLVVVALLIVVGIVQYARSLAGDARENPGASNTVGPAEGGALETGGALDSEGGYRRLPARDMPHTVSEYPPTGPETENPPPADNPARNR